MNCKLLVGMVCILSAYAQQASSAETAEIQWHRVNSQTYNFLSDSPPNAFSNLYSNQKLQAYGTTYIGTGVDVYFNLTQLNSKYDNQFVTKIYRVDGNSEVLDLSTSSPYITVNAGRTVQYNTSNGLYALDRFIVDAYINTKTPEIAGDEFIIDPRTSVEITTRTTSTYTVETESWLASAVDFFGDLFSSDGGLFPAIRNRVIDLDATKHVYGEEAKPLIIPPRYTPGIGVRGSIDLKGNSIFTASPGTLSYDVTFGDDGTLTLPFAFGENKDEATLEVFFNDELLGTVFGADYELDELSFLEVDITGYLGMSGALDFVLNTTGTQSANIFIPESIATSAVPVPAAVWLFGSGLIGLIGVARRKKA